jgi:outer membrane protein assembly factor BamB
LEIGTVKLTRTILPLLALALLADSSTRAVSAQAAKKEAAILSEWFQFRGPHRDGCSPDTGLLKQWPSGGPMLRWKATGLGEGFSSVAVAGKAIYTMGTIKGSSALIGINAADGKMLWTASIPDKGGSNGAGPRSTPATDGVLVFGLGQEGTLFCVQAATGREVWKKKMSDFGGKMMSGWGYSESPLLDGPMLVVTPGGSKGSVAALNKMTGAPAWQCGELKDDAAYTSIVPVDLGGIPQYVVLTANTIAGIAKTGKLAWKADCKSATAVASSPVVSKDGAIFVSCSYGVGCHGFQVTGAGGQFKATETYAEKALEDHHGGMVLVEGHVYGLFNSGLKCVDIKTGKVTWESRSVGKGSLTYADGMLYCRGESGGSVALVEASPTAYKEAGTFTPPDQSKGNNCWANPVVFGGHLYIREGDSLYCYDVKGK